MFMRISFFLVTFVLSLTCISANGQQTVPLDTASTKWSQKNAVAISSIDPAEKDSSDLKPLKRIIGKSRIVMLGEQSHGDGSTFLAKTRIIKFLHEEMGFDVLAFESGLYDCNKVWRLIQSGEDSTLAARRGIFGIWSSSKQVQPLFSYIGETMRTRRPLELAGFDMQFTGTASKDFLLSDLEEVIRLRKSELIGSSDWILFKSTIESFFSRQQTWRQYNSEQKKQFSSSTKNIGNTLANASVGYQEKKRSEFWKQTLANIDRMMEFFWAFDPQKPDISVTNIRDAQMADNLIWLVETFYPGRKVIVWGATSHLIRNRNLIETNVASGMIPMGQYVRNKFGDQSYVLGVTSYRGQSGLPFEGERGKPEELGLADPGSLENALNSAGLTYGVLDFRRLKPQDLGIRDKIINSRALGHTPMNAKWARVMDGILFINEMKPSTIR